MLEEKKKEILREQLGYLYKLYEINTQSRSVIKNWCVAMWSGLVVALLQKYLFLPLIIFVPIFLFWFLEAIYGGQTKLYREQIKSFERKINSESSSDQVEDIYIRSHYEKNFHLKKKIFSFLHACFASGTVASFYVSMFFISIIFIGFFYPDYFNNYQIIIPINIWFLGIVFGVNFIIAHYVARFLGKKVELENNE